MIDNAVILAAGKGSRMLGQINHPKSMIKLGDKTLVRYIIEDMVDNGIKHIIVNLHHQAEILREHINCLDLPKNVKISFSVEKELLETVGGIKKILPMIDGEEFFVYNADVYWQSETRSPLDLLIDSWDSQNMEELLLLIKKEHAFGYHGNGDFDLNSCNQLCSNGVDTLKQYVYTGARIIKKSYFDNIPENKKIGFNQIWDQRLNQNGCYQGIYGTVFDGNWIHIGDPEALIKGRQRHRELQLVKI